MKIATVREIRQDLNMRSEKELIELCLRLSKFKKENKELLTYLLYEAENEDAYIQKVQKYIEEEFSQIKTRSLFVARKSVRKILRQCKKYIRFSKKKATEIEILLFFCSQLLDFRPSKRSTPLQNIYHQQIKMIEKSIPKLHEDLQYDYGIELEELQQRAYHYMVG